MISVVEQLNKKFIDFLLDNIENNDHEQIPDLFVNLILAFNLHYEIPSENDVMKVLGERGTAKTFTEKVMLLVNRGGILSCKCIEQCKFQISQCKICRIYSRCHCMCCTSISRGPSTDVRAQTQAAKFTAEVFVRFVF